MSRVSRVNLSGVRPGGGGGRGACRGCVCRGKPRERWSKGEESEGERLGGAPLST